MADSTTFLNKAPLHIQSTQEALSLLRNLRENRKKQSPSSTYQLVKLIYSHLKGTNTKKCSGAQTISAQEYLGNNKESIESMLFFIKEKIIEGEAVHAHTQAPHENNPQTGDKELNKGQKSRKLQQNQARGIPTESQNIQKLQRTIKQKQIQIIKLNQTIKSIETNAKSIQIKLLNNMKKLTVELQEKEKEIKIHKQAMKQKNMQLEEMILLNDKKQRKIRKMEEDIYDLQTELQAKNQELQAERDCADFLQKKIDKLMEHQASIIQQKQQQHCLESEHSVRNLRIEYKKQEIGIQTEEIICMQSLQISNQKNATTQLDNEDKQSQCSSILTQSKQSKYIESIERLTMQLGEAYQRINDLIKNEQSQHVVHTQQNMRLQKQESKGTKSKSKSGYYTKFWK